MNEEVCDRTRFTDEENISSGVGEQRDLLTLVAMVTESSGCTQYEDHLSTVELWHSIDSSERQTLFNIKQIRADEREGGIRENDGARRKKKKRRDTN
jgi:hypothetical protein